MTDTPRVVLIGGTSHVGKTTLAQALARQLSWDCLSTDALARHPGRPWRDVGEVPAHVVAYYRSRSPNNLLDDVIRHYRNNVWPIAQAVVRARVSNPYDSCLVLEGSAIWPDCVDESRFERVWSVWLTASADSIARRIRDNSGYADRPPVQQALIEAFLGRSLAFDARAMASATRLRQRCVDVSVPGALVQLSRECVELIRSNA